MSDLFEQAFSTMPLVAILRGVLPDKVEQIATALYQEGFRLIEVPLNSPYPLESIRRLARCLPDDCLVGAGTVLSIDSVHQVRAAGGRLIVMPHADLAVIQAAVQTGMWCLPGVMTPTEAFAAFHAGAHGLKLFPAEMISPAVIKAMRSVLPPDLKLLPVGGINAANMASYLQAGASGFGLGSGLYVAGRDTEEVAQRGREYVQAYLAAKR